MFESEKGTKTRLNQAKKHKIEGLEDALKWHEKKKQTRARHRGPNDRRRGKCDDTRELANREWQH